MCGRYGLFRDPAPLVRALGGRVPRRAFVPRFNIAPQQPVLGLRNTPERALEDLRWGLDPGPATGAARLSTINARSETVATSRMYGPLLPAQRCVVFADGFYEWQLRADGVKQPMWISRADGTTFAFAGLWNEASVAGALVPTCTILTRAATPTLAHVHERMPVVLEPAAAELWLAPERLTPEAALERLRTSDDERWRFYPVGTAVGNVRNDGPALIAEAAELSLQGSLFDIAET